MAAVYFPPSPNVGDQVVNSFGVTYIYTSAGTWDVQNPAIDLNGVEMQVNKNKANGYAGLNADGELDPSVLPDLVVSRYLGEVANEAEMLNLDGSNGDWCVRLDQGQVYILDDYKHAESKKSWVALAYPTSPVLTVNSQTGNVVLDAGDVGAAAVGHKHPVADVANLQTILNGKVDEEGRDQPLGFAGLNAQGELDPGVLPDLAVSRYLGEVANEAAMLALAGTNGDWCIRLDQGQVYILDDYKHPDSKSAWVALAYPTSPVLTVNGQTGNVSLNAADVGASPVGHDHEISDVAGLQGVLDNAATLGNVNGAALGTAAPGNASTAARSDHVHPRPTPPDIGAALSVHGHNIADVNNLQATLTDLETKIEAAGSSGGASLGNSAGSALGTAAAGTATTAARSDHVHPVPSLASLGAADAAHTHPNASTAGAGFCPITKDNQVVNGGTGRQSLLIAGAGGVTQWVEVSDTNLPILNIAAANHGHGLAGATAPGFMPAHNNDPNVPVWGALGVMGLDNVPFWAGGRGVLNFIRETTLEAAALNHTHTPASIGAAEAGHTHPTIEAALPKRDMYFEAKGMNNQSFGVNTEASVQFGGNQIPGQTTGMPNDNMPGMWGGLWTGIPYNASDFVFWTAGTYMVIFAITFNQTSTKGSAEILLQTVDEQLVTRLQWVFNGTIEATGPNTITGTAIVRASRLDAVRLKCTVKGTGGAAVSPASRFIQGYKIGA